MRGSAHSEILDVARRFLVGSSSDPDVAAITVPEFHEPNEVFGVAMRDAGYDFDIVIESLTVAELAGERASVQVLQRLVPKGRKGREERQEVTVQLVRRDGWKVRDFFLDGQSIAARFHPVLAEPAEAEGISIRGWARADFDGKVVVAIVVRNGSMRRWRLKCAGAAWQKGRMWFLLQVLWKLILLGDDVTFDPGAERGCLVTVPAKVERIWMQASRRGRLRSPLFSLSWEPARRSASAVPFRWNAQLSILVAVGALPLVALAVLIAVFASPSAALTVTALFSVAVVLETHWCVYRLQRKLVRFRTRAAA